MQVKNKAQKRLPLQAGAFKVGLVTSRFNGEITEGLLRSAKLALKKYGVKEKNIATVSVAGAVEIPFALQKLALAQRYDCLVALGCVIRGETPHFDYVCKMAQEGVLRVSQDFRLPVGFGVLTVFSVKQARSRFHVGGEAVEAALELASLQF
ncbi:MAG: 6,7-dimethyl-8-ribityllumazine synthase [Patescibacteria group bacterium]|nr:6,7-dimethyl-8-ribityllumazine synthase [Patescibacteria group bacterium]